MVTKARLYITVLLSSVLFGISMNMFLVPSQIVSGGFSGLAIVLNIVINVPVGITVIVLNLPFLYLNSRVFGLSYIKRAIVGVLLCGLFTEVFAGIEPIFDNRIINAVLGGVVIGCSMGVLFSIGYTTGGTDLVASLIREKVKLLSLGNAIFLGDLAVILIALTVTRDIFGVILALSSIFIQTRTIDYIMKKLAA